jgi:hypothetical protein
MKFICIIILQICVIQIVYCHNPESQDSNKSSKLRTCPPHETFTTCGNLCEHSCNNICSFDVSLQDSFFLTPFTLCVPGCYCNDGYIRVGTVCVLQKYNTCGARNYILLPLKFYQNNHFFRYS